MKDQLIHPTGQDVADMRQLHTRPGPPVQRLFSLTAAVRVVSNGIRPIVASRFIIADNDSVCAYHQKNSDCPLHYVTGPDGEISSGMAEC